MTPERAIEILNPEHREHYKDIETVNEACRMGMKALEYRTAKKPVFYDTKFRQRGEKYGELVSIERAYNCPTCNHTLWITDKSSFCDNCGQALDWSDTE